MTGLTGERRQGAGRDDGRDRVPGAEAGRDPGRDRASERLARAALTRVLEPGDERAGAGSGGPARSS